MPEGFLAGVRRKSDARFNLENLFATEAIFN
jgi:hypothetical protein